MSTEFGKVRRFGAHRAPYEDLPGTDLSLQRSPEKWASLQRKSHKSPDCRNETGIMVYRPEDPDICRAAGQHMVRISLLKHMSDRVFCVRRRRSDICLEGGGSHKSAQGNALELGRMSIPEP